MTGSWRGIGKWDVKVLAIKQMHFFYIVVIENIDFLELNANIM